MFRRLSVGLPFKYQEDWVGGLYYARNLLSALALLPDAKRPSVVVIGGTKSFEYLRKETRYPLLRRVSPAKIRREPPRRLAALPWRRAAAGEIDVVLLGSAPGLEDRAIQWVPDFQEERFPHFFPKAEVDARHRRNADWFAKHRHVLVSSDDVRADLERYYGEYRNRVHVVPFASFADRELAGVDTEALRQRYALPRRFFICNNQLWQHKNHAVILRALADLHDEGAPPVVFTGKESDYRDQAFAPSVKKLAAELGVESRIRFLGFLPRADQLGLTSQAIAVIQPSLSEGWSTVIEDAKALGRHVLASAIAVHREQIDCNVDFFDPHDHRRLAQHLNAYRDADPPVRPFDYDARKIRFAEDLLRMIVEAERDFRRRRVERLCMPDP